MYQLLHINAKNIQRINDFLVELGSGIHSFRYFTKRPVEVVLRHLLAVVMVDEKNVPVAYGHLDRENGYLWLGIAVSEKAQGLGFGKSMLNYLIDYAKAHGEFVITLSVDKSNIRAIRLYEMRGFIRIAEKESYYQYQYLL